MGTARSKITIKRIGEFFSFSVVFLAAQHQLPNSYAIIGGSIISSSNILSKTEVAVLNPTGSCSGTLIHPYVVITAAHCVVSNSLDLFSPLRIYVPTSISVKFIAPLSTNRHFSAQATLSRSVKSIIVNSEYQDRATSLNGDSDLALLILNKAAPQNSIPAKIASVPFSNQALELSGFGLTDNEIKHSDPLSRLHSVRVNVLKSNHTDRELTIAGTSTANFCSGDSGGGAFQTTSESTSKQPILVGVASRSQLGCKSVGIYTNVFPYREWIQSKLKRFGIIL